MTIEAVSCERVYSDVRDLVVNVIGLEKPITQNLLSSCVHWMDWKIQNRSLAISFFLVKG